MGDTDITIKEMINNGASAKPQERQEDAFLDAVRRGYVGDKFYKITLDKPDKYVQFDMVDGLIWTQSI